MGEKYAARRLHGKPRWRSTSIYGLPLFCDAPNASRIHFAISKFGPLLFSKNLGCFWAFWCGPCKMVAPELNKVAREGAGKWLVAKVNTENAQNLARRFRVNAIPTMALLKNGVEVGRQVGAPAAPGIRKSLEPHVRNGGA